MVASDHFVPLYVLFRSFSSSSSSDRSWWRRRGVGQAFVFTFLLLCSYLLFLFVVVVVDIIIIPYPRRHHHSSSHRIGYRISPFRFVWSQISVNITFLTVWSAKLSFYYHTDAIFVKICVKFTLKIPIFYRVKSTVKKCARARHVLWGPQTRDISAKNQNFGMALHFSVHQHPNRWQNQSLENLLKNKKRIYFKYNTLICIHLWNYNSKSTKPQWISLLSVQFDLFPDFSYN